MPLSDREDESLDEFAEATAGSFDTIVCADVETVDVSSSEPPDPFPAL